MAMIIAIVTLALALVVLTIIDRHTDKLFLPRLALLCTLVILAAVALFNRTANF